MWRKIATIKKTLFINLDYTNSIYLPNFTNNTKWKNSNCITGITQINPKNNILKCKIQKQKINDNTFNINIVGYKNNFIIDNNRREVWIQDYGANLIRPFKNINLNIPQLDILMFKVGIFCAGMFYQCIVYIKVNGNIYDTIVLGGSDIAGETEIRNDKSSPLGASSEYVDGDYTIPSKTIWWSYVVIKYNGVDANICIEVDDKSLFDGNSGSCSIMIENIEYNQYTTVIDKSLKGGAIFYEEK